MHKRPACPVLFRCRLCKPNIPFRPFHSSYNNAEQKSATSSHPARTTQTTTSKPQGVPINAALNSGSPPNGGLRITRVTRDFPPNTSDPRENRTGRIQSNSQPNIGSTREHQFPRNPVDFAQRSSGPQREVYRRAGPPQGQRPRPPAMGAAPGALQGTFRDRGSARPPAQRQRRKGPQRNRGRAANEEEEKDEHENDTSHYEYLSEHHGDSFANIEEINNYAQVMDLLSSHKELEERVSNLNKYKSSSKGAQSMSPQKLGAMEQDIENDKKQIDELIPEALQHVLATEEKFLPRHEPADYSVTTPPKGQIGGTPIGTAGMGQLVEDSLRYLSRREGMEWQHPKTLAQKLAAGDFVKFRDHIERHEVMHLAEYLERKEGQDYETVNVGFEELDDAAKKTLVETIVKGRYIDPKDEDLKNSLVRNVARMASGNVTYPPASKDILLSTIREMLPQERTGRAAPTAPKAPATPTSEI